MKQILTIAGSDSGGGAGIQADLKAFCMLGVFGMSVVTAVTAQNTKGVTAIENISSSIVKAQMDAVFSDFEVAAVKIGMVSNESIINIVAERLIKWKASMVVLDPVMISTSGHHLLDKKAKAALIKHLLPLSYVVTPNIFEAEVLGGKKVETLQEMKEAAQKIYQLGPQGVLIKGGHLQGDALDIFFDGRQFYEFKSSRIKTKNTHGTGCTLSSALASFLALENDLQTSIKKAKEFVYGAIKNNLKIGHGTGPLNHSYLLKK